MQGVGRKQSKAEAGSGVVRRDTVPTMSMELGLTIEARDDREMPERILGCAQFHKPSWDAATKVE